MSKPPQSHVWVMVIIVLLASVVFFANIENRSLWEDEGWTLLLSDGSSPAEVIRGMVDDQHPPLYFLLMHIWRGLAGDSEFALRALSAFFSLLTLPALYQLGRYTLGAQAGLIAALLYGLWDFSIDVAQDARQYSLLVFLVVLSSAYFFRYLRYPKPSHGRGWFLASVAALYTQYLAGVVLVWQALVALQYAPRRLGGWLVRFGLVGLAFLPWLPIFIYHNQIRWEDPLFFQSGLPNTPETFRLLRAALVTEQFGLVIGLAGLGLLAIQYLPRWRVRLNLPALWFGLWAGGYLLLIVALNEQREILRLRIFIAMLPPLLLLVAAGLMNLQQSARAFLLAVLVAVSLISVDTRQNNPPWREVTQQITQGRLDDELILMDIWVGDFSARYYVEQQMGADARWASLREMRRTQGDNFLPALWATVENEDAFWLMRWNDDPTAYDGILAELGFQRSASPYMEHAGNRLYAHRYDRWPARELAHFGDDITLLKAHIHPQDNHIEVILWWATDQPLALDYSISVRLLAADGELLINADAPPRVPSSQWMPGALYYDQHRLPRPPGVTSDNVQVGLSVYWYAQPDDPLTVAESDTSVLVLGNIPSAR
ncbi:MAG: glycosyltransferase family 39 protein [Anaerolineales bacterium]